MKTLLISGWRALAHSYAVVNQFQCLELLDRSGVELYFEEVPYFSPEWQPVDGLFSPVDERRLRDIPSLPDGLRPDAELRIAYPYDLVTPPRADRVGVFGTAEYKAVQADAIKSGLPLEKMPLIADERVSMITPSKWSKAGFEKSGADPESVAVVPHGVDTALFRRPTADERLAARTALGLNEDEFAFLNIGAMSRNKNPAMLLASFGEVLNHYPKARLVLKGSDDLYQSYELLKSAMAASVEQLGRVLPRLTYIGRSMSFSEMAALYQAADCYVTPYSAEAFNLPALEAAACGLPIICTAGGPTDEFTNSSFARYIKSTEVVELHGEQEKTFLRPDPEHLTQLMTEIIEDRAFTVAAAESGPAHVMAGFTWRHAVDRLLDVLFD
jgi:glycosyltransferase involved in cell wall biosynthesis